MTNLDYLMSTIIFSNSNKFSSGSTLIDILIPIFLIGVIKIIISDNIKDSLFFNFDFYILGKKKTNSITFSSTEKEISSRFRAIMYFISQNEHPSVKTLTENEIRRYNSRTDKDEVDTSDYIVSQKNNFVIDSNLEIYGRVYVVSKGKYDDFKGKTTYNEQNNLEISSNKLSLKDLIKWVEIKEKKYKKILKNKLLEEQMLVEISYNSKEKEIDCTYNPWQSNASFENRFFSGKDQIVEKIKFFINNEHYFKNKGIPYTLGILLYGEPGCGKTGFIKSILNLTKRHGIKFNLSNKFDFTLLKNIIYNEEISEDVIIPQNKRIFIFEDIDAMGDAVKDRDLKPQESIEEDNDILMQQQMQEIIIKQNKKLLRKKSKDFEDDELFGSHVNDNNNLSYFLNILDGLQECPGRIIIMTTNKPEYLDKALIRPGRIDYNINMTKATTDDIRKMVNHWWENTNPIDIPDSWEQKLSHAHIISICRISDNINNTLSRIKNKIETDMINSMSPPSPILRPRYAPSPLIEPRPTITSESVRAHVFLPITH